MRLEERITRRRRRGETRRVVRDLSGLDPTAHPAEPTGRGPTLERLLDHLDPVFDGGVPPHGHVSGPKGAGKSAVVSTLFDHLSRAIPSRHSVIHTATRTAGTPTTSFAFVDARDAPTEFALSHSVLDALSAESVPAQGVGTDVLRERLTDCVSHTDHAVVAVDHVDEPETYEAATVLDLLGSLSPHLSVLTVGRTPAETSGEADDSDVESIEVPPYERHDIVDLLVERATGGLARDALTHDATSTIAAWADGDAHDALSALYGAASLAAAEGSPRLDASFVAAGIDAVPDGGCSLGRVFALSESRRQVLRAFVALDESARDSVSEATTAIGASPAVDLSETTVRRILYELSDRGLVRRVPVEGPTDGPGRPATRPIPNFSTLTFRGLDDADR